jgi:hypothetical protein
VDPADPVLIGLLDPDPDPSYLSEIQRNFRKMPGFIIFMTYYVSV